MGKVFGQVVWTGNPTADTFITNGTLNGVGANTNYGSLGAITVAGSSSGNNGTYLALLKFDLSGALAAFNSGYGAGSWTISGVTLRLAGNFAVQGAVPNNVRFPTISSGTFDIDWFSNDSWTETGVTYNNFSAGTTSLLGGFTYTPPGNNVQVTWTLGLTPALMSDMEGGGPVSLLLSPTDTNLSYLFNSRTYNTAANYPLLSVTAVPEPSALVLEGIGIALLGALWRRAI